MKWSCPGFGHIQLERKEGFWEVLIPVSKHRMMHSNTVIWWGVPPASFCYLFTPYKHASLVPINKGEDPFNAITPVVKCFAFDDEAMHIYSLMHPGSILIVTRCGPPLPGAFVMFSWYYDPPCFDGGQAFEIHGHELHDQGSSHKTAGTSDFMKNPDQIIWCTWV